MISLLTIQMNVENISLCLVMMILMIMPFSWNHHHHIFRINLNFSQFLKVSFDNFFSIQSNEIDSFRNRQTRICISVSSVYMCICICVSVVQFVCDEKRFHIEFYHHTLVLLLFQTTIIPSRWKTYASVYISSGIVATGVVSLCCYWKCF